MERRDFLKTGLAMGAGAAALPGRALAAPVDLSFPPDFKWGCATAAYQIEGAVNAELTGEDITVDRIVHASVMAGGERHVH